jgi:hypothetical protein
MWKSYQLSEGERQKLQQWTAAHGTPQQGKSNLANRKPFDLLIIVDVNPLMYVMVKLLQEPCEPDERVKASADRGRRRPSKSRFAAAPVFKPDRALVDVWIPIDRRNSL